MEEFKIKKNNNDFADELWEISWAYIKTILETVREPFVILDKNFRIVAANENFYDFFKVIKSEAENRCIYEVGNKQWNIPGLKKLLEEIVPKEIFYQNYKVDNKFQSIGRKIILLNARQIFGIGNKIFPQLILLAMEDVTREKLSKNK